MGKHISENAPDAALLKLQLVAHIVAAYVARNPMPPAEIPALIRSVHAGLSGKSVETVTSESRAPAVPIKKSVMPEFVICLEDRKKLKSLKRHLRTRYGLTPEQYRSKWGLAPDYPLVAPAYAARRSALAKKIGLGTRPTARSKRRTRRVA